MIGPTILQQFLTQCKLIALETYEAFGWNQVKAYMQCRGYWGLLARD